MGLSMGIGLWAKHFSTLMPQVQESYMHKVAITVEIDSGAKN